MKYLSLILLLVSMSGCGMTNQQIVDEKSFCEKSGMHYREVINMGYKTVRVVCQK